jgi:hypothetical protein
MNKSRLSEFAASRVGQAIGAVIVLLLLLRPLVGVVVGLAILLTFAISHRRG